MTAIPRTTDDPISLENEEALKRIQPDRQKYQVKGFKLYGEYNYVPIQQEKINEMEDVFKEISTIVTPTIRGLHVRANIADIQERIWRKFQPWQNELNVCISEAATVRDSNYCSDTFIKQLRLQGIPFIKEMLKEY